MSILVHRCLERSRCVEQLVEDWQIEHQQAMRAYDVEELARECIELGALIEHTSKTLFEKLFKDDVPDVDEAGRVMTITLARSIKVFGSVHESMERVRHDGYTGDVADEFERTDKKVRGLRDLFDKQWPSLNREMVEKSRAAYQQGDYCFTEDALNAAKAGDPQTD
jgi:hypothetical protein